MSSPTNFHKLKDAIRYALIHYENKNGKKGKQVKQGEALRHLADSLIHMAINGGDRDRLPAIKEIADRLDGKPTQAIAGVEGEPITIVQRVIVSQAIEGDAVPIEHTIEPRTKLIN